MRLTELEREQDVSIEMFARHLPQHSSSKQGAHLVEQSRHREREDKRPKMTPHTRERKDEES